MKVLFIMLELDSASGICTKYVAESLVRDGYDVEILSYSNTIKLDDAIKNYHIKEIFSKRIVRKSRSKIIKKIFSFWYKVKVNITTFMWPINSPFFTLRLYKRVSKMYKMKNYDAIIPVYSQIDPIICTHYLKKKYKSLIYVPYFIDSLSAGPKPRVLSEHSKLKKALRFENKLLQNADRVIFMRSSKSCHDFNGFLSFSDRVSYSDIPLLVFDDNILPPIRNNNVINKCELTLFFVGTLPSGIRNPNGALSFLNNINDIKITIVMIGVNDDSIDISKYGNLNIKLLGRTSHEIALDLMSNADILLNIGNQIQGMVPSKIFEYMSKLKPILSFSSIVDEPSEVYLKKYDLSCVIKLYNNLSLEYQKFYKFLDNIDGITIEKAGLLEKFNENTPKFTAMLLEEIFIKSRVLDNE